MATFKERLGIGDQKKLKADILGAIESYEGKIADNTKAANEARRERLSLTKVQTATEHDRIAAEDARDGMIKLTHDMRRQEAEARDGVRLLEERRKAFKAEQTRENDKLERKRQALEKRHKELGDNKVKSEKELTALLKDAVDNKIVSDTLRIEYEAKIKKLKTMAKELL